MALEPDNGILDKTFTEILYDRGYVTFPAGENYSDDYVSQGEKVYSVDDASLDEEVRELWIQYITERLDEDTAEYYLESEEKHPSRILTTVCEKLLSREKEA